MHGGRIRQGKNAEAQLKNIFTNMSLEIKNLHARVATTGIEILRGLDLTVEKGKVHAIMGPNGSGKEHAEQGARRPSRL